MATYHPRMRAVLSVLFDDLRGGDSAPVTYDLVPRSVEVEANTYRAADTFRLELDYADFPFDPRTIRSALVAIYMADVRSPAQQVVPTSREALRFVGYVDEPSTTLGEDGDSVTLTGRDYTALFLDRPWGGELVNVDQPFRLVVRELLAQVPGAGGILLDLPTSVAGVVLADRLGRTRFAPQEGDDAWTVLADLCQLVGMVPVIELDTLHIRSASGFGTRQAAFLHGENVQRLTFGRKQNEVRSRQIRVVSWDEATRTAREATYPRTPLILRKTIGTDGKVTSAEAAPVLTYTVAGAYGELELGAIAEAIYEESARQQVEGELETRSMRDAIGLTDLTQLRNGDAILLQLGQYDPDEWRVGPWDMPEDQVVRLLTRGPNGMREEAARALARSRKAAGALARTFYVKRAVHRMDREQGYSLQVSFINYVGGSTGGR